MILIGGRGQRFIARIMNNGVQIIFAKGNPIIIKWCRWWGAIQLLCRRASVGKPCVRVGAYRGKARPGTIEGEAQLACGGDQFCTAPWIAAILYYLDMASVCCNRPLHIELTQNGIDKLCPLLEDEDNFSKRLARILKPIEQFDY